MAEIGFLPCFSRYHHKEYPVKNFYQRDSHLDKVKKLVSAFLSSPDPLKLKQNLGSHEIQTIRPDSSEGRRIIKMCNSSDCQIHRIDYGDTSFRIIFGLSNTERNAFIFAIDTTHDTYSGKHR